MMRSVETRQERRAVFQEALELDMDRVTKELLDSAGRLEWVESVVSTSSLDQWIDTINAALIRVRAARMRNVQAVRA